MLQTKCLLESHTLYKLIAEDRFPMNNNRFAYFLKLLDGTPYSKQHKIWYCNETIVFQHEYYRQCSR